MSLIKNQKLFFLFMLCVHTPSTDAWIFTEAADAISESYGKVKQKITTKYSQMTEFLHPQHTQWDWSKIATEKISFPHTFFWGVNAIEAVVHKGTGMYSVLIDWSAVEPQEGVFDQKAIDRYVAMCKKLREHDNTPLIILFDDKVDSKTPAWFTDKKGFSVYQNIPLFVRFAQKMLTHLSPYKGYWIPLLNPNAYVARMYAERICQNDCADMLTTLEHMLIAHRDTYTTLKNMPGGRKVKIGISKQMDTIEVWHKLNPFGVRTANKFRKAFHDAFYNFINQGSMEIYFKEITKNDFTHSTFNSFDFIGITYISPRYVYNGYKDPITIIDATNAAPEDVAHLLQYHPEGLYEAIKTVSQQITKRVPILVLGNKGDQSTQLGSSVIDRAVGFDRAVYAIHKAKNEGCTVIGYLA